MATFAKRGNSRYAQTLPCPKQASDRYRAQSVGARDFCVRFRAHFHHPDPNPNMKLKAHVFSMS